MWQSKSLVIPKTEKYIAPPPPHTHTHTKWEAGRIDTRNRGERWWIKAMLNEEGWVGGMWLSFMHTFQGPGGHKHAADLQ